MESGFRKEFLPPPLPFHAAPLSNLSVAFCTVANIALPPWAPDSISLLISRVLEVFIPSLAQHLCFCCSVGSFLAHGAHPQPPWAPPGHPHLAHPVCGGVDCTNWRDKLEKLPWGINPGLLLCFGGPGSPGEPPLGTHQSLWRRCEERGSCWNLCPSEVPSILGAWLGHGK